MISTQHEETAASPTPHANQTAVNVDQLIRDLDAAYDHFPEETLRACQQHRELVIPRLIDVLLEAARLGREEIVREGNVPVFGLMLLGEFQAAEALPALMALLELPNDIPDKLFGESITEDLHRVLAILAADQTEALESLIGSRQANELVRWAAVDAFKYLVRDGRVSRHDAVACLARYLRQTTEEDGILVTALVIALADLNGNEVLADIEEAFRRGLVQELFVSLKSVKESLRPDQPDAHPELDRLRATRIENAVEEMRDWCWPSDQAQNSGHNQVTNDIRPFSIRDDDAVNSESLDFDERAYQPATIRHEAPRVGRNDPCPCGSGKKYKKCCLRQHDGGSGE